MPSKATPRYLSDEHQQVPRGRENILWASMTEDSDPVQGLSMVMEDLPKEETLALDLEQSVV